jgi:ATP-dependent DNA helicase RecQ
MRDQVENLNSRHIPATYINSSLSWKEIDRKLQMAMEGKYKFLYIAPERIETEMFLARLPAMNVSFVAVDEAHCISQWGYDFRPSYLKINVLRQHLPKVPFAAFTATAPPKVKDDIIEKLELKSPRVFTQSFRRQNLAYHVIETENVAERILHTVRATPGAGIVYARTRKRVQAMAEFLKKEGISSAAYHGGLSNKDRDLVQQGWIKNEVRVITATNAFGMGIDKPDVRFVLHLNMPADLESYYQEAGRGGRDGKPAIAVCFRNPQDMAELKQWVEEKYPRWEQLNAHYEILCNYFGISNESAPFQPFVLDTATIAKQFHTHPLLLHNSIRIFDQTGVLSLNERPEDFGSLMVCVQPDMILDYKKRYPDKAFLLDHILRTLGGEVYHDAVRFLPSQWPSRLGITSEALLTHLTQLATRGIITYDPPQSTPTIRFLHPRIKLNKQVLGWDKYETLLAQAKKRLESVVDYLKVPATDCRSSTLERYFGEKPAAPCGSCDVCLSKVAGPLDKEKIKAISDEMLAILEDKIKPIQEVLDLGKLGTKQQRLEVMRLLIDGKKLIREGALGIRAL